MPPIILQKLCLLQIEKKGEENEDEGDKEILGTCSGPEEITECTNENGKEKPRKF